MPQRCSSCSTEAADSARFCGGCGKALAAAPAASSSSSTFSAPLPAAAPLPANTARIPMDAHEFGDFLGSISRGLMRDADQVRKIKAAAGAHHFTCDQAVQVLNVTRGHPVEVLVTLYPAIVDADNFGRVLAALKWAEERQEAVEKLGLDKAKFADVLKK